MMMRQIHFASVDLELHSRFKPGGTETVFDADRRIAKQTQASGPSRLRVSRLCSTLAAAPQP